MEQQPTEPQTRRRPLVVISIIASVLLGLCLCLVVFGALLSDSDTSTTEVPIAAESVQEEVVATVTAMLTEASVPTDTPTAVPPTDTPTLAPPTATPTTEPTNTPQPTATPRPTDTPQPTATPRPTDTPRPTATSRPTNTPRPTATPKTPAVVPGLWPADVTGNMKGQGFDCTNVQESQDYYIWSCTRGSEIAMLRVDVYGRSLTSVDLIEATILQFGDPDDAFSTEFLGFVSTMPYDGADPDAARAWVRDTLPTLRGEGDVRTVNIGGVEYRLYGIPTARILEIGTLR